MYVLRPSVPRLRLLASLAPHPCAHQPSGEEILEPPEKVVGDALWRSRTPSHLVWGRVVPDIPAFCRELVAALAEG